MASQLSEFKKINKKKVSHIIIVSGMFKQLNYFVFSMHHYPTKIYAIYE